MNVGTGVALLLGVGWLLPARAADAAKAAPAIATGSPAEGFLQVMLALVLVLLLIVGMGWLMRRVASFSYAGGGAIRVLGGVAVGQRERAVLVQVGEQQLLLGVAPGRVQTLYVLPEPINIGGASPGGGESFAERLTAALKKGGRA